MTRRSPSSIREQAAEREHHGVLPLRRVRDDGEHHEVPLQGRQRRWKDEPAKAWTGTGEGKNKSSGVAEATAGTKNSITYIEWSYAKDNKLPMAQLDSGKGPVELSGDAVAKAVSEAKVKGSGNDLSLDLKYSGTKAGAYPALLVTYEIVCSKGLAADKTAIVKDFLTYFSSADAQGKLPDLGYAPLPSDLQSKVTTAVAAIQ
jgi:phosphate transport system substrate-binding protein